MYFVLTTIEEVVAIHENIENHSRQFETKQYGDDLFSITAYFKELGQEWEKYVIVVVVVEDKVYISRQKFTAPGIGLLIPHEDNFKAKETGF